MVDFQSLFLMAGNPEAGSPLPMFVMMGAVMIVFYFFMIRPQSKKAKEQKTFLDSLKKGDKVVTIGGIHGKILKVGDDSFLIEVDASTKLKIEKSAVSFDFTKAAGTAPNNKKEEVATIEEK
jgi:preprotein translocase subunit YajC